MSLRPFRPRPARNADEARALGRAWAEHEAADPESLKGSPSERAEFFYFFDEAAELVGAPSHDQRLELVSALGDAACARWRELADEASFVWESGSEGSSP